MNNDELIPQFYLTKQEADRLEQRVDPHGIGKPKYKMAKEFILKQLDFMDDFDKATHEKKRQKAIREARRLKKQLEAGK